MFYGNIIYYIYLFLVDIYDDTDLLERYRFNRNKILYITDLLHKDVCPLTGMSQSIDAVTKVLMKLRYFIHHRL